MKKIKFAFFLIIVLVIGNSIIPKLQSQISEDSLKKHIYFLASDSLEGRYPGTQRMQQATDYIIAKFKEIGIKPLGESYIQEFPLPPVYGKNIIGFIEGSDPDLKNEYIVLGAHYDHLGWKLEDDSIKVIYNGADDNASGTAGIIEIARKLYQNKTLLKRSVIIIAFDAEEKGLLGSEFFMNHPIVDSKKIKCMFSIDMIGWLDKGGDLEFSGCGSFDEGTEFMNGIKKVDSLNVEFLSSSSMWKDRTDTRPFYDWEIPCIYVSTGLKSNYHEPEDDAELINYEGMVKVCEQIYFTTIALSGKENFKFCRTHELIRTIKEPFRLGLNFSFLNNYHNYSEGPYIAKPMTGFGCGIFTNINIYKFISLQPEIGYSYYGSQSPYGKIRLNSLEIPLKLFFISKPYIFRFFGFIGGYINYSFDGSISRIKIDWEQQKLNKIDYGTLMGVGYEIFNFQLCFTGKIGLNNFYKNEMPVIGEATNISSYITLGYYFLP